MPVGRGGDPPVFSLYYITNGNCATIGLKPTHQDTERQLVDGWQKQSDLWLVFYLPTVIWTTTIK